MRTSAQSRYTGTYALFIFITETLAEGTVMRLIGWGADTTTTL